MGAPNENERRFWEDIVEIFHVARRLFAPSVPVAVSNKQFGKLSEETCCLITRPCFVRYSCSHVVLLRVFRVLLSRHFLRLTHAALHTVRCGACVLSEVVPVLSVRQYEPIGTDYCYCYCCVAGDDALGSALVTHTTRCLTMLEVTGSCI